MELSFGDSARRPLQVAIPQGRHEPFTQASWARCHPHQIWKHEVLKPREGWRWGKDPFVAILHKPLEKCCIPFLWSRAQRAWKSKWQRGNNSHLMTLTYKSPLLGCSNHFSLFCPVRYKGGDNSLKFLASTSIYICCLLHQLLPRPLQGFDLLTAFQSFFVRVVPYYARL